MVGHRRDESLSVDRIAATLDRAEMTRRAACPRGGEAVGVAQRADARHRSTRGVRGSFAPPSSAAAPSRRGIEAGSAPSSSPPTGRPVLRAGQCTSCGQDCGNRWVPGPSATCRWIEDALFKHGPKRSRPPTVRLTARSGRQPRERPRWPAMPRISACANLRARGSPCSRISMLANLHARESPCSRISIPGVSSAVILAGIHFWALLRLSTP